MRIEKRTIVMQIVMFTFFLFFGINYILKELISDNKIYDNIALIFLGLVIVGGIIWFFVTKKDDIIVADNSFLMQTKIVLYIVAGALVLGIVSGFVGKGSNIQKYMLVISGAVMSIVSLYGVYISIKAFISGDSDK